MANTALQRLTQAILTNKSGGSVAQGDVVIIDSSTASAFTTTTTGGFSNGVIGVVLEPNGIANDASGMVAFSGPVPKVNLSGSASLADLFKTHTVAKQAVRHAAGIQAGDFGIVLGTGSAPPALLWGLPAGATGAGSGDVVGPSIAVDGQVALFDGTSGKLIKDGGIAPWWTQIVDESGASFTNFTAVDGTWASDGSVIKQTNTTTTTYKAKYNTKVPVAMLIFEAEVYIHTAGAGKTGGLVLGFDGSSISNCLTVQLNQGGSMVADTNGVANRLTVSTTVNVDTWYKLRVVQSGTGGTAIYKDGTLLGTVLSTNNNNISYVGLVESSAEVWFRNIKVWTMVLPA